MYARVTTMTAKPDRINDMAAQIPALKPQLKSIAGLVNNTLAWRADGHCVVMAIYESQAAADAASSQIQSILGGMAEFLANPPQVEVYDNAADMLA